MSDREQAERFVSALYRGVLRREPDPIGLENYVLALLGGRTHASVAEEFGICDEFRHQTAVKLFVPPGHFYSPIVDPSEADRHVAALEAAAVPECVPGIRIRRPTMVRLWYTLLPFLTGNPWHYDNAKSRLRYAFDNTNYSWGDGSMLYAILRHQRPRRVIEIGSGWSSACTLDTVEQYLQGNCELTFIDPHPELLFGLIGGAATQIRILKSPVQKVPLSIFNELRAGDILFIDSTHVLRTGGDVCFELFEILPRLAVGVLVHFHDMFWPFEYPRSWVIDENRSWNELYAVRAFLSYNAEWQIIMFNDYLAKLERPLIEKTYPEFMRNSGGALWLRRF